MPQDDRPFQFLTVGLLSLILAYQQDGTMGAVSAVFALICLIASGATALRALFVKEGEKA